MPKYSPPALIGGHLRGNHDRDRIKPDPIIPRCYDMARNPLKHVTIRMKDGDACVCCRNGTNWHIQGAMAPEASASHTGRRGTCHGDDSVMASPEATTKGHRHPPPACDRAEPQPPSRAHLEVEACVDDTPLYKVQQRCQQPILSVDSLIAAVSAHRRPPNAAEPVLGLDNGTANGKAQCCHYHQQDRLSHL